MMASILTKFTSMIFFTKSNQNNYVFQPVISDFKNLVIELMRPLPRWLGSNSWGPQARPSGERPKIRVKSGTIMAGVAWSGLLATSSLFGTDWGTTSTQTSLIQTALNLSRPRSHPARPRPQSADVSALSASALPTKAQSTNCCSASVAQTSVG